MVLSTGVRTVARWSEADREKALAIAQELGAAEASRATGIPAGTIRSWVHRAKRRNGHKARNTRKAATQRRTPKLRRAQEALAAEAIDRARAEAGEYIAERLKAVADRLYGAGERALARIEEMLDKVDPTRGDRDLAAYLRSLVGAMHYGFQDAQLLTGKPTQRSEVLSGEDARRLIAERVARLSAARREGGPHQQPH